MTTRVYLLRHAETADPTVFHGAESDVDLSPKGRRQAEVIAQALKEMEPEVLVSSGMLRARLTAQTIGAACRLTNQIVPDLHERRVSTLSGQPFAANKLWIETGTRWHAGDTSFAHEGAESFDDLRARLRPAWDRVTREHQGRRIVIVAHGIVCKVLLMDLIPGLTWDGIGSIRNVAIHEFLRDVPEGSAWQLVRSGWLPAEIG